MADIKVYGTLRTMATDGIVATADQLKDTNVGKFQEVINQELAGGMEGKQDTIADLEQIRSLANSAVQPSVLQAAIADFITKSVDDLVNYYKKSETYTKAEVNGLIGAIKQFTYRVASSLPTASESTMYIIYLIPSSNASTQNVKDEFITIQDGSSYSWEQIGSTKIDLSGYSTTEEMNAAILSGLNNLSFSTGEKVVNLGADEEPTAGSDNLVKSGGVSKLISTNFFVGKGSTYQYTNIKLMKKRTYRLVLDNPSYSRDNTGTNPEQYIFNIESHNGNTVTQLVVVKRPNDTGALSKYYDFTVPQSSDYILIGGRANIGIEVLFNIFDVTEIKIINSEISAKYSQKGYKGIWRSGSTYTYDIVADDNWGISELIPVTTGTYTVVCPSDIVQSRSIAVIVYDTNKQPIDFFTEFNRNIVISDSVTKYIALSIRYADADDFALKDNDGNYLYRGGDSLYDKVEQLEESITNVDSAPTLGSDNLVKSGGVKYEIDELKEDVALKDNAYINSNRQYISNENWYVGKKVPINIGQKFKISVPSDIKSSSSQKLGVFNTNGDIVDHWSLSNRTETFTVPGASEGLYYIALSTRKADPDKFKLYVDGVLKYIGKDISYNIPLLKDKVDAITSSNTDIYTKNLDKLPILMGSSQKNNRLQVLIATDIHEDWQAFRNAIDFANRCSYINALFVLGDYGTATNDIGVFETFNTIANTCTKPIFTIAGNHDVGFNKRLRFVGSTDMVCQYLFQPSIANLAQGEYQNGVPYYYHDFGTQKIRAIFLYEFEEEIRLNPNSYWEAVTYDSTVDYYELSHAYTVGDIVNFGLYTANSFRCISTHTSSADNEITIVGSRGYRYIGQTQMQWLINTLLNTPQGYGIVICTHMESSAKFNDYYRNSKFCAKFLTDVDYYNNMNSDFLGILVDAYTNGVSGTLKVAAVGDMAYMNTLTEDNVPYAYKVNYDFSSKNSGTKFMCCLSGHTHRDLIKVNTYGHYNIIPRFTDATTRQSPVSDFDVMVVSDNSDIARDALTAVAFDCANNGVILTRIGTTATTDGYLRDVDRLDLTQ